MRVEKPRFGANGHVECDDCPCDEEGNNDLFGTGICCGFKGADGQCCPTEATYLAACKLAEEAGL